MHRITSAFDNQWIRKKISKVVLSSNQTLIWDTLKEIRYNNNVEGFGELFNNTKEFLREEINPLQLERKFDNSVEALTDIWKNKYAKKRLASLKKQDRVSKETHFYDDIIYMTWQETKDKYLNQVGR